MLLYILLFVIITIVLIFFIINYCIFKRDSVHAIEEFNYRLNDFISDIEVMDQNFFDHIDIAMEPIDRSKFYRLPEKGSFYAAGHDIYWSTVNKDLNDDGSVTINPGETLKFGTNLKIMITIDNFYLDICSRSGMAINKNLVVVNSPARIDSDYRGELLIGLKNISDIPVTIEPQSRIAQCTLHRETLTRFYLGPVIDNTSRSEGGLGHSGTTEIEKEYKGEKIIL